MSFIRDLFLPHHKNNHKAGLIKSYSIFFLSVSFIFLQFCLTLFLRVKPSVLGFSSNITPQRVIELTNSERAKLGLSLLRENSLLSEAAQQKAADMFAFDYWAHVSPSGRTPWAFFNDVGYKYQYAGENLARDFRDPEAVVRAWMNSPSHRENVVNAKYQEIGVAVVEGTLQGVETALVVQLFGTPYVATPNQSAQRKTAPAVQQQPVMVEEKAQVPSRELEVTSKEVLSRQTGSEVPLTNPLDLTKIMVIFIVGVLIGVFVLDFLLVSHRQTPRLSSRSLAQMMFLIFVLVASLLVKQGAIL